MGEEWLREVGKGFRDALTLNLETFLSIAIFLFILLVLVLIFLFVVLPHIKRWYQKMKVFSGFCINLGLSGEESRVLLKMVRASKIKEPYLIFVKKSAFEEATSKFTKYGALIQSLKTKLY